ncbi:MAG: hypothetical protein HQK76_01030 [Desulfobacterales bacterium]|nr:hypothetical protein [Desulfobacterales bacterium]
MKKNSIIIALFVILFLCFTNIVFGMGSRPKPPGQAEIGYGSSQNYICNNYKKGFTGNWIEEQTGGDGSNAWYFVPSALKNGNKAPVVVFLHGQFMISWQIYDSYIQHLLKQGIIVIFPQFNKTMLGLLGDNNQYDFMDRAINSTNEALSMIKNEYGDIVDLNDFVISAHSVGGILALCWTASGGIPPQAIVLNNGCVDNTASPDFVKIISLDYKNMASANTCPIFILWGDSDTIAFEKQQADIYYYCSNASSKAVYTAHSQKNGLSKLSADHMASSCNQGFFPDWIMQIAGGSGKVNTLDYRYYWNGIDAAIAGETELYFDMGYWSNSAEVTQITKGLPNIDVFSYLPEN